MPKKKDPVLVDVWIGRQKVDVNQTEKQAQKLLVLYTSSVTKQATIRTQGEKPKILLTAVAQAPAIG
jgi:hypothetical protein